MYIESHPIVDKGGAFVDDGVAVLVRQADFGIRQCGLFRFFRHIVDFSFGDRLDECGSGYIQCAAAQGW